MVDGAAHGAGLAGAQLLPGDVARLGVQERGLHGRVLGLLFRVFRPGPGIGRLGAVRGLALVGEGALGRHCRGDVALHGLQRVQGVAHALLRAGIALQLGVQRRLRALVRGLRGLLPFLLGRQGLAQLGQPGLRLTDGAFGVGTAAVDGGDLIGGFDGRGGAGVFGHGGLRRLALGQPLRRGLQLGVGPVQRLGPGQSVPRGVAPCFKGRAGLEGGSAAVPQPGAQRLQPAHQRLQVRNVHALRRQAPCPKRFDVAGIGIVFGYAHVGNLGLAGGAQLVDVRLQRLAAAGQLLHDVPVHAGPEQAAEDLPLVVGFGPEQLHEFALGDHGHLPELIHGQAHDLHQLRVGLFLVLGVLRAIWHDQGHRLLHVDQPRAALGRAHVLRRAAHRVQTGLVALLFGEAQLHIGLQAGGGELALQLRADLLRAGGAGLAVQRERDGVEQRALARAGVAGDQEQTLGGRFKVHDGPVGIAAEGLQRQLDRLHVIAPP